MTSKVFTPGTVVDSIWLNDVNHRVYTDIINVKNYGAVGDGSHDDTEAIQAALTEATTMAASGVVPAVYLPKGIYLVGDLYFSPSTSGVENNAPAALIGQGIRATILKAKSGTTTVIHAKNTSLRLFRDFWVDCDNKAGTGIDTDWDVSAGPSLNNVYSNIRVSSYTNIGWKALNNNDCSWIKVGIVNPTTTNQTALDMDAVGGMVSIDSITTIGGYIDVGAQDIHLGIGCVTQGIRLKYAGLNLLQVVGGYHYTNINNNCIIEVATGYRTVGIDLNGHIESPGGGTLISGGGSLTTYVIIKGNLEYTSGSTAVKILGDSLLNATGGLRCNIEIKLNSSCLIDWSVDNSKFHIVNYESFVQGFRPADTVLTLANSWVAYGSPYETSGILLRNLPGSRIKVFGFIKNGISSVGTKIAQLPVGQYPIKFKSVALTNTTGYLNATVDNTGAITLANLASSSAWVGVDFTIELES